VRSPHAFPSCVGRDFNVFSFFISVGHFFDAQGNLIEAKSTQPSAFYYLGLGKEGSKEASSLILMDVF